MHVAAQPLDELPTLPFAIAQPALGRRQAPCRRHQQRPGEVGRGVIEHARRVGRHDAGARTGGEVDVVVADRKVADGLEARCRGNHLRRHRIGSCRESTDLVGQACFEPFDAEHRVHLVVIDLKVLTQALQDFGEDFTGNKNFRFHKWLGVERGRSLRRDDAIL